MTQRLPDLTMEKVDTYTLRVAHWKAEEETGKRPLLFFNGIGANLELAFGLGDMIPDRDILTFDMPGIGESEPPVWPYLPWQMGRVARQLIEQRGWYDLDVMGVSWGGAMAQQFAIQHRTRVKRLILCATTAGITMVPGRPEVLMKLRDTRRYSDPQYMRDNFSTLYGDDDKEGARSHAMFLKAPHPRGYLYQMLAMSGWSSLPFIRFLRMPSLVIMGAKDLIVPVVNGHILNTALPNSRLHILEEGGHLFLVTKALETVPVITDFLDSPDQELDASFMTRAPTRVF